MKIQYTLVSLVFILNMSYAQNKQTKEADMLFNGYQYVDAIDAYLNLVERNQADGHVYKQLADSYYNVFNTVEAVKWYGKAIESNQDAEVYFKYAQSLKTQGRYEEANKQMSMFSQLQPNDQRAKNHLTNPNYIPRLAERNKLFDVKEIGINDGKHSDFGSFLTDDNMLYFVSSRNTSTKQDRWNNQPYLDIYKAERSDNGTFTTPEPVNDLNTPYHDGPITLSADGNTIIFARDGHSTGDYKKDKKNQVKLGQQGLYRATRVNGKWVDIQPLPFNSKDYSVSHPSLSTDGKTLYFASNMPGGMGDKDIWKVTMNGSQFGTPQNLGPNVNTAGKEGFPFISDNHILYFASNGKQGFGGFDVFMIDLNTKEEAVNLGKPVNTKSDDFSFSMNTLKSVGYFSSNRSGVDNIYTAIPVCQSEVRPLVTNANTNAVLKDAKISIMDNQNNVMASQSTDAEGTTTFNIECNTTYVLNVSKEGFETVSVTAAPSSGGMFTVSAALKPINEVITDTEVKLKNIYFDFDKSNITQQGAEELDKLVTIMKEYPEMAILVRSHTDTKGSQAYNLKLSERRAQSTVQYLISKGIDKNILSAKGMGSLEPKIDCKSNCTEEEDGQNRRSEFLIVK